MKSNQLLEVEGANVAFAFGRFNPAHQGHIEVWRAVEDAGANWFIGTNPSTLGPNDPLTFEQKSAWMAEIYPPITGHIVAEQSVLTLAAYIFKKLRKNENATVAYITDAQDWAWSGKLLNQYNGVEGSHGYYKFAGITHVPSPRVSSATALRDAARADDKVAFYHASGTDPKLKVAGLSYFDTVKQACEKYPLPVKRGQKVKEQDVAEDFGDKEAMGRIEPYGGIYIYLEDDGDEVFVQAMYKPAADGSTEMGHVLFVQEGDYLMPQDLEVEEKYQGQGIAATMYDYVKSKGYKIRRSGQQTDAGAGFWDKHKPGKNVWEQGVAEGATDLVKKVFKKNGEPVGEVGIDTESSPGNGQWYMKCYAYDIDNSGYDSYEEAVAELKYCLKQGVSEQKQRLDPKCWDGYKKQGTKMKGGVRVNNCVKENALDEKSVSKAQFRTMAAVAHNPEFAKKVGISQEVGKEFHSADKKTDYKKLPKKVDEVLDPTTMSANVLRYLGRKFATAFPWIATGAMGAGLAYSGLLAPLMASVGGVAATITSLGAETALAAGVAGTYAAPSVIQVIKDLFAADENSIQAGIKRWVEKHVGDENDIQEFLNLHAQSAYLKQPMFRWRAEEWKTKMTPKEAEAYLEKHNKGWLDAEKQKVIDAEKANIKPGVKPPVKPATESLDADQKRAGQVAGEEPAKKIGQVLAKPTKQHPYKGRLVGEADGFNGEYDDEAGMAKSNLLTTARAVAGLLKTIQDNDNLPEWSQEKIAKAEMMLVSVWDYLQSQKEQGIDPKVKGVTEAELDFGPDWDEIVKRVGQRAKQGPLKTVWDEKKRVYRNVPVNDPDQPAKEVDEASLATMRDYFAGNDDARDPTKIAQMRDFFNKNKLPGSNVKDKRFASRQAYELWLKQNGLRDLSSK